MKPIVELDISELKDFLLYIAPVRPVFIWGPPGIGKSSVINQFSKEVNMECVPLLGSQLLPEDLLGIPKIDGEVSRFVPPSLIYRKESFCLFVDEMNIASSEVQKAFYSLILDKKVGEYTLPKNSIVIGAGNRSQDSSLVKQMPSALINRMIHVHLKVNPTLWLEWAMKNDIHPHVVEYIQSRPKHLSANIAPTDESPFNSPRSWEAVSDGLKSFGNDITEKMLDVLLYGTLTQEIAVDFKSFVKQIKNKFSVASILKGSEPWPSEIKDRDVLLFLVDSAKNYLIKELPKNDSEMTSMKKKWVVEVKNSLKELVKIDAEYAQNIITPNQDGVGLPIWFLTEITKELPKLIQIKK